jgi:hypothetical protein
MIKQTTWKGGVDDVLLCKNSYRFIQIISCHCPMAMN